ncbi:MAG: DUF5011 domain-containing protein [Lachnospiraceae bacterium]|nr:DUF5011 domain-containing protein [Lachnospiraceae bacterium]
MISSRSRRQWKRSRRRVYINPAYVVIVAVILFLIIFSTAMRAHTQKTKVTFQAAAPVEQSIEQGYTWDDPGVVITVKDKAKNSRKWMKKIKTEGEVDSNTAGDYTIKYTLDLKFADYEATRTVHVTPAEPPVIKLNGNTTIDLKKGEKYEDPGFSTTDNTDGDLTGATKVTGTVDTDTIGTYAVKYTATDQAGNVGEATRIINVLTDKTGAGVIYLTFDDGPSDEVTPQVLDILKDNGIKATFFICAYDEKTKPMLQREFDEGHTVAIHGYSHEYNEVYSSPEAYMENIKKLDDMLQADFGYKAFTTRFLGGSSNTVSEKYCTGIMSELVEMVPAAGYQYMDWNVTSLDANGNNLDAESIYDSIIEGLNPSKPNVVLMHDTNQKQTTVDQLQWVIDYGKENGYSFEAIQKDTPQIHHTVNN